jgi:hypothetical protein
MAEAKQKSFTEILNTLEAEIEKVAMNKSIPALPENAKELIVKIAPWLAAVSMVMLLPIILAAFGISALALPFSYLGGMGMGFGYTLSMIFSFGMIALELMALPGLFKRKESAWRLMFYSIVLSLIQQLLRFDIAGLVIGGAIGFYILFQVKSKYNK